MSALAAPLFDELEGKRGTYALIIEVASPVRVRVGRLGLVAFEPGVWIYVGSARGSGSTSLGHRLRRHFSRRKKKHWHVDYLLSGKARAIDALWVMGDTPTECDLAAALRKNRAFESGPPGFGASDCRRGCGTHLFRHVYRGRTNAVRAFLRGLGVSRDID